jgi:hypothetical protein
VKVIYKGIEYNEGDKIKFYTNGWEYSEILHKEIKFKVKQIGEVKFGVYEDKEQAKDYGHLGFYVEYFNVRLLNQSEPSTETLCDVIDFLNGELIK